MGVGGEPSFRLELLPHTARDVLFACLRRDEAARACCVSPAWRRAFSTAHLWADIAFDAASFGPHGITEAVVRGAVSKAGAELNSLHCLPSYFLGLVPELAAAHPKLQRVSVAGGVGYGQLEEALAAAAGVSELHVALRCENATFSRSELQHVALLEHPRLRLTGLVVEANQQLRQLGLIDPEAPVLLRAATAAVRAHARTLRELWVSAEAGTPPAKEDLAVVGEFAAALGDCGALQSLYVGHLFDAQAFDVVARAAARGCPALCTLQLEGANAGRYAAAVTAHLLPSLTALELHGMAWHGDSAAVEGVLALGAALHGCPALRRVTLLEPPCMGPALADFARALAEEPGLRELELRRWPGSALKELARAGLHPALERLETGAFQLDFRAPPVHLNFDADPAELPDYVTVAQAAAVASLFAAPALRAVELHCERSSILLGDSAGVPEIERAIAILGAALRRCSLLQSLRLCCGFQSCPGVLALAAEALRGNGTLQEVRVEIADRWHPDFGFSPDSTGIALRALAAAVPTAAALRELRICVPMVNREWERVDEPPSDQPWNLDYTWRALAAQMRQALTAAAAPGRLVLVETPE